MPRGVQRTRRGYEIRMYLADSVCAIVANKMPGVGEGGGVGISLLQSNCNDNGIQCVMCSFNGKGEVFS